MKQAKQAVETTEESAEEALSGATSATAAAMAAAEPIMNTWSELIRRQTDWATQSYAAVFSPAQDPRLMESNAAGHALARSQAALARLREAREAPEIMSIWSELNTSASAFLVGYWQQMMDMAASNRGAGGASSASSSSRSAKPERPGSFDGAWPLGFDVPASMFKMFTAPMNMALQAAGKDGASNR